MDDQTLAQDMAFLDREFLRVVESTCGVRLRHDRESVDRLDRLFAGQLGLLAQDDFRNASVMAAAWLGETVKALAGGRWHFDAALGPCIVEVPGLKGSVRVLARAERSIRERDGSVLMEMIARACPLRH